MASYTPQKSDKFTFGLWTVGNPGADPFGVAVRTPVHPRRARPQTRRTRRLRRQPPRQRPRPLRRVRRTSATASSPSSSRPSSDSGVVVPMATTNLFTHPVFKDGAFTSNDPKVRAFALQKVMASMDLGAELGAQIYVFWGGREGVGGGRLQRPRDGRQALPGRPQLPVRVHRCRRTTASSSPWKPSPTSRAATSTCRRRAPCSASSPPWTTRRWSASTPSSPTRRWPA